VTTQTSAVAIERRFIEEEHRRLRAGLANLQDALLEPRLPTRSEAIERVVRTLSWLRRDVLPHAAWEEAWLYSHVDAEAGTPWATRALRFEHEQIRDVAAALEFEFQSAEDRWTTEHGYRIVIALTRLETLVAAHILQEERLIMPTLGGSD
jgi:hemerythrin-like domain-containing protein